MAGNKRPGISGVPPTLSVHRKQSDPGKSVRLYWCLRFPAASSTSSLISLVHEGWHGWLWLGWVPGDSQRLDSRGSDTIRPDPGPGPTMYERGERRRRGGVIDHSRSSGWHLIAPYFGFLRFIFASLSVLDKLVPSSRAGGARLRCFDFALVARTK